MIKAYFFDWMGTLSYHGNGGEIKDIITKEESDLLMTQKLKEVISDKDKRTLVHSLLSNESHYIYPDSEYVLDFLKDRNYSVSIISNMYDITAKRIRKLFPGFLSKFNVISLSAEIRIRKPQQEIFLYTLDKLSKMHGLNVLPEEVMMIGDKQDKDIEPALKLGMQARLIDRNNQNLMDIIKNG